MGVKGKGMSEITELDRIWSAWRSGGIHWTIYALAAKDPKSAEIAKEFAKIIIQRCADIAFDADTNYSAKEDILALLKERS